MQELGPIYFDHPQHFQSLVQMHVSKAVQKYVDGLSVLPIKFKAYTWLINEIYRSGTVPWCIIEQMSERPPVVNFGYAMDRWPLRCCIQTHLWPDLGFVVNSTVTVIKTA